MNLIYGIVIVNILEACDKGAQFARLINNAPKHRRRDIVVGVLADSNDRGLSADDLLARCEAVAEEEYRPVTVRDGAVYGVNLHEGTNEFPYCRLPLPDRMHSELSRDFAKIFGTQEKAAQTAKEMLDKVIKTA